MKVKVNLKVKFTLEQAMKAGGQCHAPAALPLWKTLYPL